MTKTEEIKARSSMMCEIEEMKEKYHEYFTLKKKYDEMKHFVDKFILVLLSVSIVGLIAQIIYSL